MKSLPWIIHDNIDPFERLLELTGSDARVVADGGANKGRTVTRFLDLFPAAEVHAYEPMPRLARKLAKRFAGDHRVRVRAVALGSAPDILRLNVLERLTCCSLLEPTGIRDKHADKCLELNHTVEVDVIRLDEDLEGPPDILKLDLQGYELEALRGAERLLAGISTVLCEVSFSSLYAGQPLGPEVIAWMEERGFRAEGLYAPWHDGDGGLVSADALFVQGK